jgi:hypothetical protein
VHCACIYIYGTHVYTATAVDISVQDKMLHSAAHETEAVVSFTGLS